MVPERFRAAWLSENMPLLVLRLLRHSALSELEILSRLQTTHGLSPSSCEFATLEDGLLGDGFVIVESGVGGNRLGITAAGIGLLRRLEDEYRDIVSGIEPPSTGSMISGGHASEEMPANGSEKAQL